MGREEMKNLISKARSLNVKLDEVMVSCFEAGSLNGGQETYFLRQLQTGIQEKESHDDQPKTENHSLIERAKSLGVDTGPYSQLLNPGSVSSMQEMKLKSELLNAIAEKEVKPNE